MDYINDILADRFIEILDRGFTRRLEQSSGSDTDSGNGESVVPMHSLPVIGAGTEDV